MKGIVFSEFIEMVEERFSPEVVDEIIESTSDQLESGGSYTAVGVYDHLELVELVEALAATTGVAFDELVRQFGAHLAGRFAALYPGFFHSVETTFDFLESVDNHIHKEVLKLYPDAELPRFFTHREGEDVLVMEYRSSRPFSSLAKGLIQWSGEYFGEKIAVTEDDLSEGKGNHMRFTISRQR